MGIPSIRMEESTNGMQQISCWSKINILQWKFDRSTLRDESILAVFESTESTIKSSKSTQIIPSARVLPPGSADWSISSTFARILFAMWTIRQPVNLPAKSAISQSLYRSGHLSAKLLTRKSLHQPVYPPVRPIYVPECPASRFYSLHSGFFLRPYYYVEVRSIHFCIQMVLKSQCSGFWWTR